MGKAEDYRKRAIDLGKKTGKRAAAVDRTRTVTKQKALNDMADNEDWLDGKPGSQLKSEK